MLLLFGFHAAPPLCWIFTEAFHPSDLPTFLQPLPNASAWVCAAELMNTQLQAWLEFLLLATFQLHCLCGEGSLGIPHCYAFQEPVASVLQLSSSSLC